MSKPKIVCRSCGGGALLSTIEATNGYCRRCLNLPLDVREKARRQRAFAAVELSLRDALQIHLPKVSQLLGLESIYGFALFTDPFYETITPCIFTEAGLQRSAERYKQNSPSACAAGSPLHLIEDGLRWRPVDSPYLGFREIEDFHALQVCLDDLWRGLRDHDDDDWPLIESLVHSLESTCVAALRELRTSKLVPPSLTILLVQDDQGPEERIALAELFNSRRVTDRLMKDLSPKKKLLNDYRARFAHYRETPEMNGPTNGETSTSL